MYHDVEILQENRDKFRILNPDDMGGSYEKQNQNRQSIAYRVYCSDGRVRCECGDLVLRCRVSGEGAPPRRLGDPGGIQWQHLLSYGRSHR